MIHDKNYGCVEHVLLPFFDDLDFTETFCVPLAHNVCGIFILIWYEIVSILDERLKCYSIKIGTNHMYRVTMYGRFVLFFLPLMNC